MARFWFGMGCLMVGLAVAAGAFGAHGLKQRLSADLLAVFETGVRYQILHGLGLVALALAMDRWGGAVFQWAGWLWLAGILLFSGSLYALSLTGVRSLGAVTPLGACAFCWVGDCWSGRPGGSWLDCVPGCRVRSCRYRGMLVLRGCIHGKKQRRHR